MLRGSDRLVDRGRRDDTRLIGVRAGRRHLQPETAKRGDAAGKDDQLSLSRDSAGGFVHGRYRHGEPFRLVRGRRTVLGRAASGTSGLQQRGWPGQMELARRNEM
jgi:hypothetical protein